MKSRGCFGPAKIVPAGPCFYCCCCCCCCCLRSVTVPLHQFYRPFTVTLRMEMEWSLRLAKRAALLSSKLPTAALLLRIAHPSIPHPARARAGCRIGQLLTWFSRCLAGDDHQWHEASRKNCGVFPAVVISREVGRCRARREECQCDTRNLAAIGMG